MIVVYSLAQLQTYHLIPHQVTMATSALHVTFLWEACKPNERMIQQYQEIEVSVKLTITNTCYSVNFGFMTIVYTVSSSINTQTTISLFFRTYFE